MTIVADTYLTFTAIGQREDLIDKIFNISPEDTPFTNAVPSNKATATLHEWQTDALDVAASNAQLQGDDVTFTAATPTVRLTNRTQISRKDMIVADTLDKVNKAGRDREYVYQTRKKTKSLRRDVETSLLTNQAKLTGNSTTAPLLHGLPGWFTSNVDRGAGGTSGSGVTGSEATATNGTTRPLTESMVKSVLKKCWDNGGDPDLIMVGSFNKQVVSGFTGNATRMDKSEDRKVIATVDVYESDFGKHKIVANRFQRDRDLYALDTGLWAVSWLRKPRVVPLAKTGDAEKGMVICEYTLESRNQAGSGVVADLTVS